MNMKTFYSILTILTTTFCSIQAGATPEKIEVKSSNPVVHLEKKSTKWDDVSHRPFKEKPGFSIF